MGYICNMKKKGKKRPKRFERPEDPWWNPDEEPWDDGTEETEEEAAPVVNELLLQTFIEEWQPESDERITDVRAIGVGELREMLQIYRTFDCKSPDPLPFYMARLESHGFRFRMGFCGEQVMLVRKRNNGNGIQIG